MMVKFGFLRAIAISLPIVAPLKASAHGMTPALEAIIQVALIQRCSDEHPNLRDSLAEVRKPWDDRISNLHLSEADRIDAAKASDEYRTVVNASAGKSTETECRLLIRMLQLRAANPDGGEPDLTTEPASVAMQIGMAKACETVVPDFTTKFRHKSEKFWDRTISLSRKYEGSSDFRHMVEDQFTTKSNRPRQLLVEECENNLL